MAPSGNSQCELPTLIAAELAGYRALARDAAREITFKELGFHLGLTAKGVDNQFRLWNRRNHPSAESGYLLRRLSSRHDEAVANLMGRIVSTRPRMNATQFARAVQERASKGYVSAAEIAQLAAQTDFTEEEPVPLPLRAAR
jgi:hypothetical protein